MVSLHVPLGVTIACLIMIFCFWFPTLRFSLGYGYEAKAELYRPGNTCTTTIRSSPEVMHEHMDEFNQLSEVPTSKPALFMNAKLVSSSSSLPQNLRGRQRKKSHTPRGEISWNRVEIMRNQSRFPWNQPRKSAQPSSSTHFYNIWHFWGKSRGNQTEIRKSCTPKLLVADPSTKSSQISCLLAVAHVSCST